MLGVIILDLKIRQFKIFQELKPSKLSAKYHWKDPLYYSYLTVLNALDSFPKKKKKIGKLVRSLKRLPTAQNKRWEQMAQEASQDVCSDLCHTTHSQDNPDRGCDGKFCIRTSFEFIHAWS